jgi:2-polyprenyl-3-methyl-5-hydroxy-6-metoxy-1,4-benzoquinol methylase
LRRVTVPGDTVAVVGAGASLLVGALLETGRSVIAIDIAAEALAVLKQSLSGSLTEASISYIATDVCALVLDQRVDAWHDRAVFHFLTDVNDQRAYVRAAMAAVRPGGHCIMATFAPDGPTQCSGLDVARHDAPSLQALFAPGFTMVESFEVDHRTPWDSVQRFTYALLQRM